MPFDQSSIRLALTRVTHPMLGMDIVSAGAVSKIAWCDGLAGIKIAGNGLHADHKAGLQQQIAAAVRLNAQQAGEEVQDVHVEFLPIDPQGASQAAAQSGHRPIPIPPKAPTSEALPGVKHVIAVGAGKGGVGKSTVAVNLGIGLARRGHSVGLMDADIYGPSFPTMLGLSGLEAQVQGAMLQPFLVHGVKAMTIGKLVDPEKPLIWRGPMAHGAFKQLVEQTQWVSDEEAGGGLDYLVIDLPPGTGDVALTMAQMLKLTGAVVVCTPQKVAQDDAVRAARMFQQLNINILGVVENMSYFIGDDGKEYDIFGRGGAERLAQRLGVPFVGNIPINMSLRQNSDSGEPTKNFTDRSPRNVALSDALEKMVTNIENQVAMASLKMGATIPTLKIS